ncbi:MAG TPA: hypothetical protein VJL29_01210 [Thermoguttaceae bacterium]|nr:hypothetical protein [Thermoguttaceae bacterium]
MCERQKHRVVILAAGIGLVVVALAGCEERSGGRLSRGHKATSLLRISMRPNSLMGGKQEQSNLAEEFRIFKATQAELIRSPFVLTAALRKPEIASLKIFQREKDDPVGWLRENLEISFPGNAEIMEVSLADSNQNEAVKMVRAVVDAYLSEVVETERNQKARELANLDERLAAKEREIRQKRTTLKQLAEELGTTDSETLKMQMQFATQQLSMYRKTLVQVQSELRNLRVDRQVLQTMMQRLDKQSGAKPAADAVQNAQPELRRVAQEMSALVNQLGQIVVTLSDAELSQRLQDDLAGIQQQIGAWRQLLDARTLVLQRAELQEEIERLDVKLALIAEEEATHKKEIDEQIEAFHKLGLSSVDLEMMRADMETLQRVVNEIATRRQVLEVELKSPPRVRLLQRAETTP